MKEGISIEFLKDHSPRKKGEVVSFTGRDGVRAAKWYLSNGIAKEHCNCKENTDSKCSECDKLVEAGKREAMSSANNFSTESAKVTEIRIEVPEDVKPKKKTKK